MIDLVVIGAGAAGLFTAIQASMLGLRVMVLEKNPKPGLKILVSGGGRCNFTNLNTTHLDYQSQNPHFCKSALAGFTAQNALQYFESLGIGSVEKAAGQLFCKQGAKFFLQQLLGQLQDFDVELRCRHEVKTITPLENKGFSIEVTNGTRMECQHVVIANGGLSWPKLGANPSGYQLAKTFGHSTTPLTPGLVPFLWPKELEHFSEISGVATSVELSIVQKVHQKQGMNAQRKSEKSKAPSKNIKYCDDLLITHHGISGPAALKVSNHWSAPNDLCINWLPRLHIVEHLLQQNQQDREKHLKTTLEKLLPKRLIPVLLPQELLKLKTKQLQKKQLTQLESLLHHWTFTPKDVAGFGKAEVTMGGVNTKDVSSKTMESQLQAGLYFVGEVLDVTGQLGGFNFQWAWSSAYSAAQAIWQKSLETAP
jgi:predicted Rossmann fold flavoprotein